MSQKSVVFLETILMLSRSLDVGTPFPFPFKFSRQLSKGAFCLRWFHRYFGTPSLNRNLYQETISSHFFKGFHYPRKGHGGNDRRFLAADPNDASELCGSGTGTAFAGRLAEQLPRCWPFLKTAWGNHP